MRWLSAALIAALSGGVARADPERVATAERTIETIAAREREHRARLVSRARALYKAARPGLGRLWVDPSARLDRGSAMVRLLRRDVVELALLIAEREAAITARDKARGSLTAHGVSTPAAGALIRPVQRARVRSRFGGRRHAGSSAELSGRGIELESGPGEPIVAVASGRVLWIGGLFGGARAVLVEHADAGTPYVSVLVGFGSVEVSTGQLVGAGETLGQAAGESVHLEIRLRTDGFGRPIDPAPLLGR